MCLYIFVHSGIPPRAMVVIAIASPLVDLAAGKRSAAVFLFLTMLNLPICQTTRKGLIIAHSRAISADAKNHHAMLANPKSFLTFVVSYILVSE